MYLMKGHLQLVTARQTSRACPTQLKLFVSRFMFYPTVPGCLSWVHAHITVHALQLTCCMQPATPVTMPCLETCCVSFQG